MSAFTRHRSLAHPEWLPQFFGDFDRQTALIKNGTLPEVLYFPFLVTLACRILKIAFKSRWAAARYIVAWAWSGTREHVYGSDAEPGPRFPRVDLAPVLSMQRTASVRRDWRRRVDVLGVRMENGFWRVDGDDAG
jgi:hypothetical protein